jgi:hypothetical protein
VRYSFALSELGRRSDTEQGGEAMKERPAGRDSSDSNATQCHCEHGAPPMAKGRVAAPGTQGRAPHVAASLLVLAFVTALGSSCAQGPETTEPTATIAQPVSATPVLDSDHAQAEIALTPRTFRSSSTSTR